MVVYLAASVAVSVAAVTAATEARAARPAAQAVMVVAAEWRHNRRAPGSNRNICRSASREESRTQTLATWWS